MSSLWKFSQRRENAVTSADVVAVGDVISASSGSVSPTKSALDWQVSDSWRKYRLAASLSHGRSETNRRLRSSLRRRRRGGRGVDDDDGPIRRRRRR